MQRAICCYYVTKVFLKFVYVHDTITWPVLAVLPHWRYCVEVQVEGLSNLIGWLLHAETALLKLWCSCVREELIRQVLYYLQCSNG